MRREAPIHAVIQQHMRSRQRLRQLLDHRAHRAAAAVPNDLERPRLAREMRERLQVRARHRALPRAATLSWTRLESHELAKRGAVDRLRAEQQLEAVLIARIVRAGHHDAAVEPAGVNCEVQQRRRSEADPASAHATGHEPRHQRVFQYRRALTSIARDRDGAQPLRTSSRRKRKTERMRIVRAQLAADDAAQIVRTHGRGIDSW